MNEKEGVLAHPGVSKKGKTPRFVFDQKKCLEKKDMESFWGFWVFGGGVLVGLQGSILEETGNKDRRKFPGGGEIHGGEFQGKRKN